jgi:hypothetical protein
VQLIGMYYLCDHGEGYHTGEIMGLVESVQLMMVKPDEVSGSPSDIWVHEVYELVDQLEDGRRVWHLFETREQLAAFMTWVGSNDTSKSAKVVPLHGHKGKRRRDVNQEDEED